MCMKEIVREQTLRDNCWKDGVDEKVEKIQEHLGKRVCPVCGSIMDRKKRKCVNEECRVDLKKAEDRVSGSDVLGTALVAPVRKYNYNIKETTVGFTVEGDGCIASHMEVTGEPAHERDDIPSAHPPDAVPITVSDPVFVNPSSYSAVKDVLRNIGKTAGIKRYCETGQSNREWLPVTMDGAPYSLAQEICQKTLICVGCESTGANSVDNTVWKDDWEEHVLKVHKGARVKYVKEFDWVVLRIGKLHMEMNMGKYILDFTWEVFMSALAYEMGFTSEAAQMYARRGTSTHHTMTLLKVAQKATWMELLVPYVREKLRSK